MGNRTTHEMELSIRKADKSEVPKSKHTTLKARKHVGDEKQDYSD